MSNHLSHTGSGPHDNNPLIAHDRMVIDFTRKAVARLKSAQKREKIHEKSLWPETIVVALQDGGCRRIHALPPGFHVPRREISDGAIVYGCMADQAMAGTAPLKGKDRHKSNRPLVLAPQVALERLTIPAPDSSVVASAPTRNLRQGALPAPTTEAVPSGHLMSLASRLRT